MSNPEALINSQEPMQPEEEDLVESDDQPTDHSFPTDVGGAASPDREGVAAHLAERGGDEPGVSEEVPAGGAGADAGAGQAARVSPESDASVSDESIHNDEPGVGTRRADDE